jgi:hypothetical protein
VNFNRKLRLEFHGAKITRDAGLFACREMDDGMGLTEMSVGRVGSRWRKAFHNQPWIKEAPGPNADEVNRSVNRRDEFVMR